MCLYSNTPPSSSVFIHLLALLGRFCFQAWAALPRGWRLRFEHRLSVCQPRVGLSRVEGKRVETRRQISVVSKLFPVSPLLFFFPHNHQATNLIHTPELYNLQRTMASQSITNSDQPFKRAATSPKWNWPGLDYSAAHAGGFRRGNAEPRLRLSPTPARGLAPPRRPLPFAVTTEPYIQIAVNNFSGGTGQPCLVGT